MMTEEDHQRPVEVRLAKNDEQFAEGINKTTSESVTPGLEEYYQHLAAGQLKEATKTMNQLSANAEDHGAPILSRRQNDYPINTNKPSNLKGHESTNRLLKEAPRDD